MRTIAGDCCCDDVADDDDDEQFSVWKTGDNGSSNEECARSNE